MSFPIIFFFFFSFKFPFIISYLVFIYFTDRVHQSLHIHLAYIYGYFSNIHTYTYTHTHTLIGHLKETKRSCLTSHSTASSSAYHQKCEVQCSKQATTLLHSNSNKTYVVMTKFN